MRTTCGIYGKAGEAGVDSGGIAKEFTDTIVRCKHLHIGKTI